jgi:hypothetical protein
MKQCTKSRTEQYQKGRFLILPRSCKSYDIIALMCGAYGFTVKDAREVYERFDIINTLEYFQPRWNIRIGTMNPVIFMTADGVQIKYMYWLFLIPHESHLLALMMILKI